jgi:hypothetical protein
VYQSITWNVGIAIVSAPHISTVTTGDSDDFYIDIFKTGSSLVRKVRVGETWTYHVTSLPTCAVSSATIF